MSLLATKLQESMGSDAKSVRLKVFVDKKKNKVIFAEAEEDFVDILFSFLTLPLGRIARLTSTHTDSKDVTIGSLSSLYQSVVNLDVKFAKERLMYPKSPSASFCKNLKLNLYETDACVGNSTGSVVVVKKGSFIITDDLKITPFMLDRYIELVNSLGDQDTDFVERNVYFGLEQFSNILKWSLLTNNPLTCVVLGGSKTYPCSSFTTKASLGASTGKNVTVKLMVQKSTKKVLCAQVDDFFVQMLFSFLTIPLGTVKHLTIGDSSSFGIDNVYKSVSSLGDGNYLKRDFIRAGLLSPQVANDYCHLTDLLPINENRNIGFGCYTYLAEQATFVVSDDLEIAVSPSMSTISKFTNGVPVRDLEVLKVSIGEPEALLILKASLTSQTVLTDCLDAFRNKIKEESST